MGQAVADGDPAGADGESFGRLPSLTHQIKELIHDYPEGIGIVKELIQNADDAGARTLRVVVDLRSHPSAQLPSTAMAALQGPALLAYNDSTFTDDDFERIQEIYRSGKIRTAEKTGQFGKGFNTVYNVTDFPGFVTGERVAFFDPHGAAVHKATRERPGRTWRLGDCWKNYPDLLRPFAAAGLKTGETDFKGTIFRLPFRTPERARSSEISRRPFGKDNLAGLLRELVGAREGLLLFLKNLLSLSVVEIAADAQPGTRKLLAVETTNVDEVRASRDEVLAALRGTSETVVGRLQSGGPVFVSYRHRFASRWASDDGGARTAESEWRVVSGLCLDDEGEIAEAVEDFDGRDMKAVPLGGAAARIDAGPGRKADTLGKAYCALPLPVATGMPVHLNGFFDLDSSRHSLTTRAGLSGNSSLRARWNELLIEYVVSRAYARLVEALASDLGAERPDEYYARWPGDTAAPAPFDALPAHVYRQLETRPVVRAAGKARWAQVGEVKVAPAGWEGLTAPLAADGAPVPDPPLPAAVAGGFETGGVGLKYLRPEGVRTYLRVAQPLAVPVEQGPRPCLRRREWVEVLLCFALSDNPADLTLIPLGITAAGTLRTFGTGPKGEPLFVASAEERELFASRPEWFLDVGFAAACGLESRAVKGLRRMCAAEVVECLPALLPVGTTLAHGKAGPPGVGWLTAVYRYLIVAVQKGYKPQAEQLQTIAMVPDQGGQLVCPGSAATPLLVRTAVGDHLRPALVRFGVPLVTAPPELFEAIAAFVGCCGCNFVWSLTGPDLVDTLATIDDSDLPPFDRGTYVPLIEFLAAPRWRTQWPAYSPDQKGKLTALPIFPTRDGRLVRLDDGAVIPGEFALPPLGAAVTQLELGEENRWRPLFVFLGVPVLGRAAFIEDHLVGAYGGLDVEGQRSALDWLRVNLNAAVSEREGDGGAEGFRDVVRGAALVRCADGVCRPAPETYDPAAEVVRDLLGAAAPFPDVQFYTPGLERWLAFFRTLGMTDRVRARDVLAYVDRLVVEAKLKGVAKAVGRIVKVFQYLDGAWGELGTEDVDDGGGTLAEALKERAWLPAERQRLSRWPAAAAPEDRLFRPEELYLQAHANLVASQAPVLSVSRVGDKISEDLGFSGEPSPELVLDHFEQLIDSWNPRGGEKVRKAFETAFDDVYRYISTLDGTDEGAGLSDRFADRPCLLHDGKLWQPRHAFRAKVASFFGSRRTTILVKGQLRLAFRLLGLRERLALDDFLAYLDDLSGELGGEPATGAESHRILTLYHRLVEVWGDDGPGDRRFPLLAADGRLVQADEVFFNDAPWFAERMQPGVVHLLHSGLPVGIRKLSWVRSLADDVVERPVGVWRPTADRRAAERAGALERVVRSEEFRRGVARLINHTHGVCRPAELNWLGRAAVRAVDEIRSELVATLGGEEVVVGSGQANHYWDPAKRTFYLVPAAGRLMARYLADGIDGQLDRSRLGDLSNLFLILESEPGEIDLILTGLRIKPLEEEPTFTPPEEDWADEPAPDDEPEPVPGRPSSEEEGESAPEWADGDDSPAPRDGSHAAAGAGGGASGRGAQGTTRPPEPQAVAALQRQPAPPSPPEPANGNGQPDGPQPTRAADHAPPATQALTEGGAATGQRSGSSTPPARPADTQPRDPADRQSVRRSRRGTRRSDARRRGDRVATYVSGPPAAGGAPSGPQLTEEQRRQSIELGNHAVEHVLEFEQKHGRQPTRLAHNHPGYDVESIDPRVESVESSTGGKRLIEVKGIRGGWTRQGVSLSSRQFRAAREHGESFWLYVVEFADDPAHALVHPIRDPFAKITEFWFDRGWRQLADPAEAPSASVTLGREARIEVEGHGRGTVTEVIERGALKVVVVRLDAGGGLKKPFNPKTMKLLDGA